MSTVGEVFFLICAVFALAGAVGTVAARSPLRAALALLVNIVSLAGLYLLAHAPLLAALQLLVYAGAVVVLFVFVIMLIGPSAVLPHDARGLVVRTLSFGMMAVVTAGIAFAVAPIDLPLAPVPVCLPGVECHPFGGVYALGEELYRRAAVPFELISILLLVAILGAVAVARGRSAADAKRSEEASKKRPEGATGPTGRDQGFAPEAAPQGWH